jgi:hypothetical protein
MSEFSESNEELVDVEEDDVIVPDEDEEENASNTDSVNVTKEFQENVIKFVKIDDLIRKKTTELAELKSQKKPIETFILKYLDQVNETVVEITNGKLRKNKSETKAGLTIDIIKEAIEKKVKDPKIVEEILKSMEDLRPKATRVNLKRTSVRDKIKAKTSVKKVIKKT